VPFSVLLLIIILLSVDANAAAAAPVTDKHGRQGIMSRRDRGHHAAAAGYDSSALHRRPTFGQWLKGTWLDIVTMICMGAIGLGVYMAKPAPSRSFPITFQDGEIVYTDFAYPLRKEIVPIFAAALLASLVPIFIFLVMQIRIRSFWDVNNAVSASSSIELFSGYILMLANSDSWPSLLSNQRCCLPSLCKMAHWWSSPPFPRCLPA